MTLPQHIKDRIASYEDLKQELLSSLMQIMPPDEHGEDSDCSIIQDSAIELCQAAITEATRAQMLVEALEYLIKDIGKPNDTRYATALNKATEALKQYNQE